MKYSKEEILKALEIIKTTCEEIEFGCEGCPFLDKTYGECEIGRTMPSSWKIKKGEEQWRAFL